MTTANTTIKDLTKEMDVIFQMQKAHHSQLKLSTFRERSAKLKKLHEAVLKYKPEIREALYKDFRKHPSTVDLTEIYPVTGEIKHTRRHLYRWMQNHGVGTPLALLGSKSWIQYEPKGVVLIISPWNFPVNLTFGPLVAAVAAGNNVIIKPSEHTPHASSVMKKIIDEVFDPKEVTLVEGGVEVSQALLQLPFNHIFFTGSPGIGKIVMAAAAKNLASVTLELGGKSPTIVDETANLNQAATRIAWAKYINNGQVCIAPDYLFVHEKVKDKFIDLVQKKIKSFYGESAQTSDNYSRMVNPNHYKRVKGYIESARAEGAEVIGGKFDDEENYIEPTIVTGVNRDSDLMTHEIFGPVMPINVFKNIEEPLKVINSKETPLALYIYSGSRKNIKHIMKNTTAGGTCINHSAVHFFNNNLPFGGSNNSGIGKSHGFFGFQAFSNARGVYKQISPLSAIELMMPPYSNLKQKLIDLSIKWF